MSADRELLKNAVLNVVMGAGLGALFMASLLALNVHDISHMLRHSTSPAAVTIHSDRWRFDVFCLWRGPYRDSLCDHERKPSRPWLSLTFIDVRFLQVAPDPVATRATLQPSYQNLATGDRVIRMRNAVLAATVLTR